MMKTAAATTLVSALIALALAGATHINFTKANPNIEINTMIQIDSPKNITYTTENIPLSVVVTGEGFRPLNYSVTYRIDTLNPYSSGDTKVLGMYLDDGTPDFYNATLIFKENGKYILIVTVGIAGVMTSDRVYFTVETEPLNPQIIEPESQKPESAAPSVNPSPEPQESEPEPTKPFPVVPFAIVAIVVVAVVAADLLVYLKKRKRISLVS